MAAGMQMCTLEDKLASGNTAVFHAVHLTGEAHAHVQDVQECMPVLYQQMTGCAQGCLLRDPYAQACWAPSMCQMLLRPCFRHLQADICVYRQ